MNTLTGTRLYYELSLPANPGSRGKIDSWHERIIFPYIDFEGFNPFPNGDDVEGGIDIPIERLG